MRTAFSSTRSTVNFITRVAAMTALAVIVKRFMPQVSGLNLGGFPIVLAGLIIGPLGGAYVGGLSDIVGYYLMPHGAFNVFFTLTSVLTGVLPALAVRVLYRGRGVAPFWVLAMAIFFGQFVTKGLLFPLFFKFMMNAPIIATMAWNTVVQLIHAPLYAIVAGAVMRALPRALVAVNESTASADESLLENDAMWRGPRVVLGRRERPLPSRKRTSDAASRARVARR